MKVLLTGGAGFIGLHLARALADLGYTVDLIDNFSRGDRDEALFDLTGRPNVTFYDRDLLAPESWQDFDADYDCIYHLAAALGVTNVLRRPFQVLRDNVSMVAHALDLARRQTGLSRFVFASTSEVYAGTLTHFGLRFPTPEDTPLTVPDLAHPRTSYMLSKIYGEALCHQSAVPFTILRPHNVYGPRMGMAHVIPELLAKAYRANPGTRLEVFSVDHSRTFCYVDDAVELVRRAAEAEDGAGRTLNVGNEGPEVSIGELAALVIEIVGASLSIEAKPPTPGSPARRCPDMTITMALTGYRPKVDLREGVARTLDWYKRHVFEGEGAAAV